jgi:hypothetical protein
VIVSVKEVISASVASLISLLKRLAGKAKVGQVKSVALHSIATFMFAKMIQDVEIVRTDVKLNSGNPVCDNLWLFSLHRGVGAPCLA